MSYYELKPAYYQSNQPTSPWHAGSRGWTESPWVTWGGNPNQVGPAWQGVDGLGHCGTCAASGLGAFSATQCKAMAAALKSCHANPNQPTCKPDKWGGPGVLSKKWLDAFTSSCPSEAAAEAAAGGGAHKIPTWAWVVGAAALGVGTFWFFSRKKSGHTANARGTYRKNRVWKYREKAALPSSAFLLPSARKFPFKSKSGKVDLPHLRNALARIPQSNLAPSTKKRLTSKARKILDRYPSSAR